MSANVGHTPWVTEARHVEAGDEYIGYLQDFTPEQEALVIRAVNSYDQDQATIKALREALVEIAGDLEQGAIPNPDYAWWSRARSALAMTEKGAPNV